MSKTESGLSGSSYFQGQRDRRNQSTEQNDRPLWLVVSVGWNGESGVCMGCLGKNGEEKSLQVENGSLPPAPDLPVLSHN